MSEKFLSEKIRRARQERATVKQFRVAIEELETDNADLRAQLATLRADYAATVAALDELRSLQISEERTARLAAEGQVAELRMAIEKALEHMFDLDVSEDTPNDGPAVVTYSYLGINTLKAALAATPSGSGAAAVLAQADQWESDRQKGGKVYVAAILALVDAVAAWRAARGEGGANV